MFREATAFVDVRVRLDGDEICGLECYKVHAQRWERCDVSLRRLNGCRASRPWRTCHCPFAKESGKCTRRIFIVGGVDQNMRRQIGQTYR